MMGVGGGGKEPPGGPGGVPPNLPQLKLQKKKLQQRQRSDSEPADGQSPTKLQRGDAGSAGPSRFAPGSSSGASLPVLSPFAEASGSLPQAGTQQGDGAGGFGFGTLSAAAGLGPGWGEGPIGPVPGVLGLPPGALGMGSQYMGGSHGTSFPPQGAAPAFPGGGLVDLGATTQGMGGFPDFPGGSLSPRGEAPAFPGQPSVGPGAITQDPGGYDQSAGSGPYRFQGVPLPIPGRGLVDLGAPDVDPGGHDPSAGWGSYPLQGIGSQLSGQIPGYEAPGLAASGSVPLDFSQLTIQGQPALQSPEEVAGTAILHGLANMAFASGDVTPQEMQEISALLPSQAPGARAPSPDDLLGTLAQLRGQGREDPSAPGPSRPAPADEGPRLRMQTSRPRHHAANVTPQRMAALIPTLRDIHGSSGPMAGSLGRRAPKTAFGMVSGTGNQGPHSLAHIMKTVLHEAGFRHGQDPFSLIGTPAAPQPLRALRMLHEHLMHRGPGWRDDTRPARQQFYDRYSHNFTIASDPARSQDDRLRALRYLLELNPATTTRLTEGTADPEHMKGKGENRRVAVEDIIATYNQLAAGEQIDPGFLARLRTVDTSGNSAFTDIHVQRMFDALLAYAGGVPVPSDSEEQTRSPGHTRSTSDRRSGGGSSTMGAGPSRQTRVEDDASSQPQEEPQQQQVHRPTLVARTKSSGPGTLHLKKP